MSERTLKAGATLCFGAPAKPMPEVTADAILQVVVQVPGIIEAHLPQCFMSGDTEARQVLVVGVEKSPEIPQIAEQLMSKLRLALPAGPSIDILPFAWDAVPPEVRQAGCQIFVAQKKP